VTTAANGDPEETNAETESAESGAVKDVARGKEAGPRSKPEGRGPRGEAKSAAEPKPEVEKPPVEKNEGGNAGDIAATETAEAKPAGEPPKDAETPRQEPAGRMFDSRRRAAQPGQQARNGSALDLVELKDMSIQKLNQIAKDLGVQLARVRLSRDRDRRCEPDLGRHASVEQLESRARSVVSSLRSSNIDAEVAPSTASVGGGAFPTSTSSTRWTAAPPASAWSRAISGRRSRSR